MPTLSEVFGAAARINPEIAARQDQLKAAQLAAFEQERRAVGTELTAMLDREQRRENTISTNATTALVQAMKSNLVTPESLRGMVNNFEQLSPALATVIRGMRKEMPLESVNVAPGTTRLFLDPNTGKPVSTFNVPAKPDAWMRKYNAALRANVGEDLAEDAANGFLRVVNDEFNNPVVVNQVTAKSRRVTPEQAAVIGEKEVSGEGLPIEAAAIMGIGPKSGLKTAVARGFGFIPGLKTPGLEAPAAKDRIRRFNKASHRALTTGMKNPVYEQKELAKMLPNPDQFVANPDIGERQYADLRRDLMKRREIEMESIEDRTMGARQRREAVERIRRMEVIIKLMGDPNFDPAAQLSDAQQEELLRNATTPQELKDAKKSVGLE